MAKKKQRKRKEPKVKEKKLVVVECILEIGNKAGKESVKSRLCRTKGGKPCNASERMK